MNMESPSNLKKKNDLYKLKRIQPMALLLMYKSSAKAKYHDKPRQSICFKLCQYQIHAPNSRQKKFKRMI